MRLITSPLLKRGRIHYQSIILNNKHGFHQRSHVSSSKRLKFSSSCLFDSQSDIQQDTNPSSGNEFEGFNPFIQNQRKSLISRTLSLRKIQMDELTENLLQLAEKYLAENMSNKRGITDDLSKLDFSSSTLLIQMNGLLKENEGLLLEPIVGGTDAALEMDSIYRKDMTTAQRFDEYERVMILRQGKAQNQAVKLVLWAMANYVNSRRSAFL